MLFQTRKRKPKGMKNSDGTTKKGAAKNNSDPNANGKHVKKFIFNFFQVNDAFTF